MCENENSHAFKKVLFLVIYVIGTEATEVAQSHEQNSGFYSMIIRSSFLDTYRWSSTTGFCTHKSLDLLREISMFWLLVWTVCDGITCFVCINDLLIFQWALAASRIEQDTGLLIWT